MRKARDVRDQLVGLCERVEIDPEATIGDGEVNGGGGEECLEPVLKSVAAGFFYNVAKLGKTGDYQTVKMRHSVHIHPSSVLHAKNEDEAVPHEWLCYFELAFTTREFMRQVCPVKGEWLLELAPHYYNEKDIESEAKKTKKGIVRVK